MSLEKGKITGLQLGMLTVGFVMSSSLLLPPGLSAKQDSWAAVLLGLAEGLLFAAVYLALIGRFRYQNTFDEICVSVLGSVAGRLVALFFLGYLLHLGSLVISDFSGFFTAVVLPRTPPAVVALLLALTCAMAAGGGIEVIARSGQVLTPIGLLTTLMNFVLLLKNYNPQNMLPMFQTPLPDLLRAAHEAATFPFGEAVAFVMALPFLSKNEKGGPLSLISGLLLGGFFLTASAVRLTLALGATTETYAFPVFQAVRLIHIRNVFTRMEVLVAAAVLSMGFLKIAALLYGAALGAAQVLKLNSYRPLVVPLATLMTIASLQNFKDVGENLVFSRQVYPLYAVPFEVGIPLVLLLLALVRKLPRKGK